MASMASAWASAVRATRLAAAPMRRRKKKRMTAEQMAKLKARLAIRRDAPMTQDEVRRHEVFLKCLDPPAKVLEPLSAEELAFGEAIAKAYQRGCNKVDRLHRADMWTKTQAKACAIAALPTEELRMEAFVVTEAAAPLQIRVPTASPPQAGWHRPDTMVFLSPEEEEEIRVQESKTSSRAGSGSAAGGSWADDS